MSKKKYDLISEDDDNFGFYEWNKPLYLIKDDDKRAKKFKKQKQNYGFSDDETWSLDASITIFILPRLKRFCQLVNKFGCYPAELKNKEEWQEILDKMVFSFETMFKEWQDGEQISKEDQIKKNEGLKLFAQYFESLWW